MVIDALPLLYADSPDAFGIVSSDADFTPLVMHRCGKSAAVYGFSAKKTSEPVVNACSRLLFLDQLAAQADTDEAMPSTPLRVPSPQLKQDTKLVALLRNAVQAAADDEGCARIGAVGQPIANQNSFDQRKHGYATPSDLFKASQLFAMAREGTSAIAARDKRAAKPIKS